MTKISKTPKTPKSRRRIGSRHGTGGSRMRAKLLPLETPKTPKSHRRAGSRHGTTGSCMSAKLRDTMVAPHMRAVRLDVMAAHLSKIEQQASGITERKHRARILEAVRVGKLEIDALRIVQPSDFEKLIDQVLTGLVMLEHTF